MHGVAGQLEELVSEASAGRQAVITQAMAGIVIHGNSRQQHFLHCQSQNQTCVLARRSAAAADAY